MEPFFLFLRHDFLMTKMTQEELSPLFPPSCYMKGLVLLVPPAEFRRLEGRLIDESRIFMLVCQGSLDIEVNGKPCRMEARTFYDGLDTIAVRIKECSETLSAWACLVTFKFASESLKNLKPGPSLAYLLNRLEIPVKRFSELETNILERQLHLLEGVLNDSCNRYRQELAALYFKSFSLELGNIMFNYEEKCEEAGRSYVCKRDFVVLNFMKLVLKHFKKEHQIGFYADSLCISAKYLARIVKEMTGKSPHAIVCDEIVHHSMTLLEDDSVPIGSIAEELHFSDQAAFCKFFKKQTKVSPMAYRRKGRRLVL